jgi:putative endopeptidase
VSEHICLGYDDQGRQFDAQGNLVDWWTPDDSKRFKERAQVIIDQFNSFKVYDKHINGELTQGENIADLGGAKISYMALQQWMKAHGRPADIAAFNPEQQFFLSWAQIWRNNIKKENALMRIVSDPHSPGEYRTNGPLTNFQEFFDAFGEAKPGDGMYREKEKRVQIW